MTLQNKNNQFLGNNDNDANGSDDITDIFDQYGAGDDRVVPQVSDYVSDTMTEKIHDDQSVSPIQQEPIETASDNKNDSTIEVGVSLGEKKWESQYEGGHEMNLSEEGVVKNDHTEKTKDEISEKDKNEPLQLDITTLPKEPEIQGEKMPTQSVVPPVTENINAVIVNEPLPEVKKSFIGQDQVNKHRKFAIDPSKKTIAIVDDDVDTCDMYANIFESADYNVIRASDGLEALSVIGDHTPHLVFTGIIMPRMDGFAMMEALKQNARTADIPVVINSHLGRESDRKRAEELGAKDFIVRGFTSPREVLERIGALLLRSEYTFRFDAHDPEARKLVKDLGANNFFTCPRGQEMVIKLRIIDPKDLTFSARFSCVDRKSGD